MNLRFSPETSPRDRDRISKGLEAASREDPAQAALIASVAPALLLRMEDALPSHMRFQLDPLEKTLSINARIDMDDAQLAEGVLTRFFLARQMGLSEAPVEKSAIALVEKPVESGSLSRTWEKAAASPEVCVRPAGPGVRKPLSAGHN